MKLKIKPNFISNRNFILRMKTQNEIHLFDIDVPGKIRFQESEVLTAGDTPTMFSVGNIKVGVGICYDIRFPELAWKYRRDGADLLVYPGLVKNFQRKNPLTPENLGI